MIDPSGTQRWRVRTTASADDRPLVELAAEDAAMRWLVGDEGLVAWGEAIRLPVDTGELRLSRLDHDLRTLRDAWIVDDDVTLPGTGLVAFVSATFDLGSSRSVAIVPRRLVGRRSGVTWLTTIDPVDGPTYDAVDAPIESSASDRVRFAGSTIPDVLWLAAVDRALEEIAAGRVEKVVLARDHAVWSRVPFSMRLLVARLHRRFPDCFTFHVDGLVGASPELLVRRFGMRVESVVLAGSVARGGSEPEDEALALRLLASEKDHREHVYAADSVRDVLLKHCDPLESDAEPQLFTLDNVRHLATRARGTLSSGASVLTLADDLHPTAAVGGTPTAAALEVIRELEGMDRGRYAGPVGWADANGDGELAVALRCAEVTGARARLFAGAGIVAGSLPEAELEETHVKLLAMRSALEH